MVGLRRRRRPTFKPPMGRCHFSARTVRVVKADVFCETFIDRRIKPRVPRGIPDISSKVTTSGRNVDNGVSSMAGLTSCSWRNGRDYRTQEHPCCRNIWFAVMFHYFVWGVTSLPKCPTLLLYGSVIGLSSSDCKSCSGNVIATLYDTHLARLHISLSGSP